MRCSCNRRVGVRLNAQITMLCLIHQGRDDQQHRVTVEGSRLDQIGMTMFSPEEWQGF